MFESVPTPWPAAILLCLATIATIAAMARSLPLQNVLMAAFVVAVVSAVVGAVAVALGFPAPQNVNIPGPRLFHIVPWTDPLLAIVIILNSRSLARLTLRPWRDRPSPGFRTISLAVVLSAALHSILGSFASNILLWAPATSLITFPITALLALVLATPWLINKKLAVR
jgi:hypothetical protein